ncbi:hypothetical protein DY000_02006832 [Brassica cretica]|uniref:Uncharacterized protein n=1 Tax=Brassica cretica TaxID=69181 RepID=A0ABQ7BWN6_BRACR|nr:hypothetical protein DY000_02006832 [Brassica cretica]
MPIDTPFRPSIDTTTELSIDNPSSELYQAEHRPMKPTESTASCNAVRILTHEEFASKHPHPPNPDKMPKIDVARLNALRPKPKPSENPPEPVRTPSDDGEDPMEEDRVPTGRTLRRRKEKVVKHLKRGANEKEKKIFGKRVFRIPLDKPFEKAYYTNRLWMFFRETREDEEDVKRIQEVTHISSRRINDPGIIAACHCGAKYETDYSASIETHTATSINSGLQKSTDTPDEESVDSRPDDWENDYYNPTIDAYTRQHMHTEEYDEDYEDERATEYKAILDEEDTLLHHSSWKRNAPSIDIPGSPSIDTQPPQRNRKCASTDIANYSSIDAEVNRVREGDYSIGSWADDHHHESYAVETSIY